MRVLLIWPQNKRAVLSDALSCCEPLPLEYLAGALRAHHDVAIHDLRLDPPLESLVEGEAPGLIGIAVPYTTAIPGAREVARKAKQLWPNVPLVLGGHHPTVSAEWMDSFAADFVVRGEGGHLINHLAHQLERGGPVELLPGLAPFCQRASLPRPDPVSLDDLAPPDRTVLARNRPRYFHSIYRPVALVRFSAGCPYNCTFCSLWRMTDRRYLTKNVSRILAELQQIEIESVYVVDDEAFIQPRRMIDLAEAIEQEGLRKRYHMYVRTDTALRNADVIARWAEIGLDSVLVGAESMDDHELDEYQKGAVSDQTRDAVRLFHSLGVKVRTNFIVRPDYRERDFARVARQVEEMGIDIPSFSVLTPLPGTDLFDATRSHLISTDPELFDCYHTLYPTALPPERFYSALATLLEVTASRSQPGVNPEGKPSVFYFSNDGAFGRMLQTIREGHLASPPSLV